MLRFKSLFVIGFLLLLLSFRFLFLDHNRPNYINGQYVVFETVLLEEPKIWGKLQRFSVEDQKGQKIFIKTIRFPEFHYAQSLLLSGPIEFFPRKSEGRINGASKKISSQQEELLNSEQVIMTMNFPKIELGKNEKNSLSTPIKSGLAFTSFLRQRVSVFFQKSLPPISSGLLLGIVLGVKQDIPSSFSEQLRISGVFHVVAASGMNVTIIASFLSSFFILIFKRQLALIFCIFSILFYALLAGAEPSIVRASIMAVLGFSASILGRQKLAIFSLFVAGYLMLLVSPRLISDIGFQLSFLSTLGLLYIKPIIEGRGKLKNILDKSIIGNDITTTVSAQIAAMPVLLLNFGIYSFWSVAVNALVLWTVPVLMILGGFGAILNFIFEPLARFFLYLALPFLLYFQSLVTFFSERGLIIELRPFPYQFIISYYFLLASFVFYIKRRRK